MGDSRVVVGAPMAAAAQTYTSPYLIYFNITSTVAVFDIAIFNLGAHGCCGYGFAANGQAIDTGNTTITDGFTKTDEAAGALLTGLTTEADQSTGVLVFGNAAFAAEYTGQAFTEVEFSDGAVVGGGTSYEAGVPEPAAWGMMLLGLGLVGGMRRHARDRRAGAGVRGETLEPGFGTNRA